MSRTISLVGPAAHESTDDVLVDEAKADPARFSLVYERYRLRVFRYLRARGESEADAAELMAATFERALRALPRYRARGGGLPAWLFRIARNASHDERRRRERLTPLVGGPEDLARPSQSAQGPAEGAELRMAVLALPDAQREAILLRFAGGLTAAEIGVVIGKSAEASQKLIERALAILREELR